MKTKLTFASLLALASFGTNDLIAQNTFPASGRVGIYTLTPNSSLQVAGGARFGRPAQYLDIDSATGNLSFGGNAALRVGGNRYAFQYSGDPDYGLFFNSTDIRYEFRNNVAAATFFVGANTGNGYYFGNVGINVTSPTARLHINTSATEDALRIQVGGATKFLVDNSGNLGIGTGIFTPEANLHILRATAGAVTPNANAPLVIENSTSNFINLLTPDANEKGILFGDVSNASDGGIIYNSSNAMQFRTNGNTTRMTLNSTGNLEMEGDGTGINFNGGQFIRDNAGAGFSDIEIHGDFVPDVTNSHALGSSTQEWIEVWAIDGSINLTSLKTTKNVKNLPYGLKEIMKLRPVIYNRINNPEGGDGSKRLGILADEIKTVIPEAVKNWRYSEDKQTKKITKVPIEDLGISLDNVIPVLVRGMQEQQAIIEEQNKKIEALTKLVELSLNSRSVTSDIQASDLLKSDATVSSMKIIPNPAKSSIMVEGLEKSGNITIVNMQGRQVLKQVVTGTNVTLNIGAIPSGTYMIQYLNNGKAATQKFIKE